MNKVFVLQHQHTLPGGEEDLKMIGVYSSEQAAVEAVKRLRGQPGFRDYPNIVEDGDGFYVSRYPIDKDHWAEGYVSTHDA
jgi:homoserine kinase type II